MSYMMRLECDCGAESLCSFHVSYLWPLSAQSQNPRCLSSAEAPSSPWLYSHYEEETESKRVRNKTRKKWRSCAVQPRTSAFTFCLNEEMMGGKPRLKSRNPNIELACFPFPLPVPLWWHHHQHWAGALFNSMHVWVFKCGGIYSPTYMCLFITLFLIRFHHIPAVRFWQRAQSSFLPEPQGKRDAIYSTMALLVASATARTGRRETCSGRSTHQSQAM